MTTTDPLTPAENTMTDEEFLALMLQSDHAPGDAEIATNEENFNG
jgi:hypothetical protein